MGTRHQLYIIARSPQGEYICLTVIHFQFMAENMCQVVAAFFALVRDPFNAAAIKSELCALGDPKNDSAEANTPCPYVKKLIIDAAVSTGEAEVSHFLPRDSDPWWCDNNSGITVIDITQPTVPRYCFAVLGCFSGDDEDWPIPPIFAPLSVKDYLESLYTMSLPRLVASDIWDSGPGPLQGLYDGLMDELVIPPMVFKDWDPCGNFSTYGGRLPPNNLRVLLTQDADGNLVWPKGELGHEQQKAWTEWSNLREARLEARSSGDQRDEPRSPSREVSDKRRKFSSVPPEEQSFIEVWREKLRQMGKGDKVVYLLDHLCHEVPDFPLPPQAMLQSIVPSLVDIAISAIEPVSGLRSHASDRIVSQHIARKVLQRFQNREDIPESLFPAFIKSFAWSCSPADECLDLDTCSLTVDQLSRILEFHAGISTINVSSNPHIDKAAVQLLVNRSRSIKKLILVNCHGLKFADMDDLVEAGTFGTLDGVVCTNSEGLWTLPGGLWFNQSPMRNWIG